MRLSQNRASVSFIRDENGSTVIEYALIAAMIAVACIASFNSLGGSSSGGWGNVANKVGDAMK
jgi:pilus assembly protein Flp/PilA